MTLSTVFSTPAVLALQATVNHGELQSSFSLVSWQHYHVRCLRAYHGAIRFLLAEFYEHRKEDPDSLLFPPNTLLCHFDSLKCEPIVTITLRLQPRKAVILSLGALTINSANTVLLNKTDFHPTGKFPRALESNFRVR